MHSDFNFDTPINRRDSDSLKWGRYGPGVLPLWVADMDFAAPPPVLAALQRRLDHGVFGYGLETDELNAVTVAYLRRQYGWEIEADWLVWLPGLVSGLNVVCKAVEGGVFTTTPVYPPFMSAPRNEGRVLSSVPLCDREEGWRWDFDAADRQLAASGSKLWLLCHPHNPIGRVWSDAELERIAALAQAHDLVVCSDEIHCDLILDADKRHRPFASLNADAARRSITLMAPSKTYNIPGLGAAWAVVPDAALRQRFTRAMQGIVPHLNVMGTAATQAALSDCEPWRLALLDYLRGNAQRVQAWVKTIPDLRMHPVEATYLAWIDAGEWCRRRNIDDPGALLAAAGVALSPGRDFDCSGGSAADRNPSRHFLRLNFGCPRATLDAALEIMARAIQAP